MSEVKAKRLLKIPVSGTLTLEDPQVLLEEEVETLPELVKQLLRSTGTARRFIFGQLTGEEGIAVQFPSFRCDFGVIIKAHAGNAGMVYIGDENAIAAGGPRIGGFELDASEAIILPIRLLDDLYMFDTPGGQIASYFAM